MNKPFSRPIFLRVLGYCHFYVCQHTHCRMQNFCTCCYLLTGNFTIPTEKSCYSHCFDCLKLFYKDRQYVPQKWQISAFVRKANCSRSEFAPYKSIYRSPRKFEFVFAITQSLTKKVKIYKMIWFMMTIFSATRKVNLTPKCRQMRFLSLFSTCPKTNLQRVLASH